MELFNICLQYYNLDQGYFYARESCKKVKTITARIAPASGKKAIFVLSVIFIIVVAAFKICGPDLGKRGSSGDPDLKAIIESF
jgi:hypothetical protein